VDKDQPVFVVTSMRSLLDDSIARRRFSMQMMAGFGALALILFLCVHRLGLLRRRDPSYDSLEEPPGQMASTRLAGNNHSI